MASDKKVILVFSECAGKTLQLDEFPALSKICSKGAMLAKLANTGGNVKAMAGAGATEGETLWDAAANAGFVVADLDTEYDMCVLDAPANPAELEAVAARALESVGRKTLVVLVLKDSAVFYGPGIERGKVVDKEHQVTVIAPTIAHIADFPVPAQCDAPVAYLVMKDRNFKLQEINKLKTTILNMEAAMERSSRKPWDKHDCA